METLKDMYRMKSLKRVAALGLVLALSAGQQAWAAQQQEEDSVYRWGRWAVLSPAAGGDSYEGQVTPDAANNARPGEASEFQPVVAAIGTPPVPPVQPPSIGPDPGGPIGNLPLPPAPPPSIGNNPGGPIGNLPLPPAPPPSIGSNPGGPIGNLPLPPPPP